jgi:L-iditol 2-dehydrogenase
VRVVRLHGVGDIRVADEADPEPGDGQSLVRVSSVGLCGSDLHWFAEGGVGETVLDRPVVPGHEFGGVALTGRYAGRRVAVDPAIPCGHCEQCVRGDRNLCHTVRFAGHGSLDGGLRQLLAWPDEQLFPVPDHISDDGVALLEPMGVALHSLDLGHLRVGADVLVAGAGPIGLLAIQLAHRAGARRVFATEPLPHRRTAAAAFGATAWAPDEAEAALADATGGRGVDLAFEFAGTDEAIATAVAAARPGARVLLGGIPSTTLSAFPASIARRKGLTFVMVRRMNEIYPRTIALAAAGQVELDALVSHRFGLEDSATAFRTAVQRGGIKTIIAVPSPS